MKGERAAARSQLRLGLRLFGLASVISAQVASVLGALTVAFLGPPLAMGASFYLGCTEPAQPGLPFPWPAFLLLLLPSFPALLLRERLPRGLGFWSAAVLSHLAFFLPWWQLYRLVRAAVAGCGP